jgi:hypothetical protein
MRNQLWVSDDDILIVIEIMITCFHIDQTDASSRLNQTRKTSMNTSLWVKTVTNFSSQYNDSGYVSQSNKVLGEISRLGWPQQRTNKTWMD